MTYPPLKITQCLKKVWARSCKMKTKTGDQPVTKNIFYLLPFPKGTIRHSFCCLSYRPIARDHIVNYQANCTSEPSCLCVKPPSGIRPLWSLPLLEGNCAILPLRQGLGLQVPVCHPQLSHQFWLGCSTCKSVPSESRDCGNQWTVLCSL